MVAAQTVEGKFSALDGGKVWPIIFKCRARVREIHTHALTSQAVAQTAAVRRHRALLQNLAQYLANDVYTTTIFRICKYLFKQPI
jgi:hypothetical protein